ncbi:hypothetical protein K9N50_09230 [bacterium]|nr:hypothetical protein [bacterium]
MTKQCITVFLIVLLLFMLFPQNATCETTPLFHGLGLSAGMVGGWGFSYRLFPEHGLSLHSAFLFWNSGEESFFNFAVEPLYVFHRGKQSALYGAFGGSLIVESGNGKFAGGIGLGFSWCSYERIWTSFDLMMTAWDGSFMPLPQGSIHYVF